MDSAVLRETALRISYIRTVTVNKQPFFGRLLLRLNIGFAECGTAYTDMQRIVFDPAFASRLSDEELRFVLLHELMHCVLKHCTRGFGKLHLIYNIACDIVVNSVLLEAMGQSEMLVDNSLVMHLAPDGNEGQEYSAEEIYRMLLEKTAEELEKAYGNALIDSHEVWSSIISAGLMEDIWNRNITEASKAAGYGSGLPEGIKRLVAEVERTPKVDWRQILHDFIQKSREDFTFSPPDYRYSDEFFLPSFRPPEDGGTVEKIWFVVDTSGSVTDEAVGEAMKEIRMSIEQIGQLGGYVSFFDSQVSEPIPFENAEEIKNIKPIGGGGTSFDTIFRKLTQFFEDELPTAIIVITDGYATFPDEKVALSVPTVWLIVDSEVNPPWGGVIKIRT